MNSFFYFKKEYSFYTSCGSNIIAKYIIATKIRQSKFLN